MKLRECLAMFALAFASNSAVAGVRIETINVEPGSPAAGQKPTIILVQDGSARVDNQGSGGSGAMILKGGTIYILDDQRRSYREMDKATLQGFANQANAMMLQMQEQMKSMPPEQRAQMEKMMNGMMPGAGGGASDTYEAKDTGKSETVEGRKCRVWNMLRNGQVFEELCIVSFSSLPGKEDFQAVFKQIAESFAGLASAIPNAGQEAKIRSTIDGYPVRTRSIQNGKPTGRETILKTWKEESVPVAAFQVPSNYKKLNNPQMGMPGR
jgi:hypothetical protein